MRRDFHTRINQVGWAIFGPPDSIYSFQNLAHAPHRCVVYRNDAGGHNVALGAFEVGIAVATEASPPAAGAGRHSDDDLAGCRLGGSCELRSDLKSMSTRS